MTHLTPRELWQATLSGLFSVGAYGLPVLLGVAWSTTGAIGVPELAPSAAPREAVVWVAPPPAAEDGVEQGEGAEPEVEGPPEGEAPRPTEAPPVPAPPDTVAGDTEADAGGPLADALAIEGGTQVAGRGGRGVGAGAGGGVPKPWKGRKPKGCDQPHPNIHPADDGTVVIDRALVDQYTKNLETFMTLGYSRPYDEDGLEGWYISGFSCSSPVHKAGFRRGDVLLSVNGKKTRTWMGVFLMYQKLKNKEQFEIQLVRKGEPVTLRFRVVPS